MARVVMRAVVSADCYIAYPDDAVGPLFDWYGNGDTEVSARASGWTFHVSQPSADYVRPFWEAIKVTVTGRHLFDTTNGWDGDPAAGDEPIVVTHREIAMDVAPVVLGEGGAFSAATPAPSSSTIPTRWSGATACCTCTTPLQR
jgi:hypothetical protein